MNKNDKTWYLLTSLGAVSFMLTMIAMFSGGSGFMLFGFLTLGLLGAREFATGKQKQDERQAELMNLAGELGCAFRATAPLNVLGWSSSFHLTRESLVSTKALEESDLFKWLARHVASSRNVLERTVEDMTFAVFDFEYSKDDRGIKQTVFALQSPDLQCRHFALVPAGGWDHFRSALSTNVMIRDGRRLITTDDDIAERLNDELFNLLYGPTCLEVGEGYMLLYRKEHLTSAIEIEHLIKTGITIHSVLADLLTACESNEPVSVA